MSSKARMTQHRQIDEQQIDNVRERMSWCNVRMDDEYDI